MVMFNNFLQAFQCSKLELQLVQCKKFICKKNTFHFVLVENGKKSNKKFRN
jgi:hypothetical protein